MIFRRFPLLIYKKIIIPRAVHKRIDAKVIVIRVTPGFDYEIMAIIVREAVKLKGIVIEMFGAGNCLVTDTFLAAIREAKTKGIVVVASTQCLHGGVSLDIVSVSYCCFLRINVFNWLVMQCVFLRVCAVH